MENTKARKYFHMALGGTIVTAICCLHTGPCGIVCGVGTECFYTIP